MNKEYIKELEQLYSPIIEDIIRENANFYQFNRTIKWQFDYDENLSIMATCNRKTNVITININSVNKAYLEGNLHDVEYIILHEIRHVFQHLIISDFKKGLRVEIDKEIVKKWIYEGNNYIKSLDEKGKENPSYFLQDSEMDSYAFSLAVMRYKYGEVNLYIPSLYGEEFYKIVDEWIEYFKEEKL